MQRGANERRPRGWRTLAWAGAAACLWGCTERDRPTGPSVPGGSGPAIPIITIFTPGADTSVVEGSQVLISGTVEDDLGVDSLFVDIQGGGFSFSPSDVGGLVVPFAFTVMTTGLSGQQLSVTITAKDDDGNSSSPATRVVSVQ